MPTDIPTLLRGYSRDSLVAMARWRGLDMMGKKEELVARLAPGFFDREGIESSLASLSEPERALLDLVTLAGGSASTAAVRGQLRAQGVTVPSERARGNPYQLPQGSPTANGSRKFEDLVARLGSFGLLFTAIPLNSGSVVNFKTPGRQLYIPEEVQAVVPPVNVETELAPDPPTTRAADPSLILRDLYLLISFAEQTPISLTTRGLIPKRTLVAIDSGLRASEGAADVRSEEELGRLPFLRALAEQLGLLEERLGKLHLGDNAAEELSRPPLERRQRLLAAYEATPSWCELPRIPQLAIEGRGISVHSVPDLVVAARRRILQEIRELPAERWISLDHLMERLRKGAYEFLFPRDWSPNNYYYGYGEPPSPYEGGNKLGWVFGSLGEEAGWSRVEGGMIRVIVTEALHWLGIIDLGEDETGVTSFRVTKTGAQVLRGEPVEAAPPDEMAPNVVVQPNFQVFVFEPTSEGVLLTLDRFAERRHVDQAIEYELTRESVSRGLQHGLSLADVLDTLEQISRVELPQNVRRTLEEWGAIHERITIRREGSLLQAIDSQTLDRLYDDPRLAPLLSHRFGPTIAGVSTANLSTLYERLLAAEKLPALSEGDDRDARFILSTDSAGGIHFTQPLPSIFVMAALRTFSEETEDSGGDLQLTPASLRRGARTGLSPDQIIERLRQGNIDDLPEEVVALVRRQAKDWGAGALTEATVLFVESAEILRELLADPELRDALKPVPGSETLAVVRPNLADQVRDMLAERGMELSNKLPWIRS